MNTTTKAERDQLNTERRAREREASRKCCAERFGLKIEEVIDHHSGSCYDKVWVTTKAAAEKVCGVVKEDTVNGGWYDGMPLGGIVKDGQIYEVMC